MHQGLLCSELDLSAMGQQPGHGQIPGHGQLQYPHAGMNASLAAGMAHLGLQGSLMENLHGGTWQVGALIPLLSDVVSPNCSCMADQPWPGPRPTKSTTRASYLKARRQQLRRRATEMAGIRLA